MILGLSSPKFVGTGNPNTNTVLLDYSVYKTFNFAEPRIIKSKAPITGSVNILNLGNWSNFDIIIYLWKYSNPLLTLANLINYRYQNVIFYPHRDKLAVGDGLGLPITDTSNNPLSFFIAGVKYYSLDNTKQHDCVELNFISTNYVKKGNSVV